MRNFSELYFIKMFFLILVVFVTLVVVSVAILNINDSVPFTSGEIIAEVPQIDYKAPFEAIPSKIFVEEGKAVKKGDTLMVLADEQLLKDYEGAQAAYPALQKIDTAIAGLTRSAYDKIDNLKRERQLNSKVYTIQKLRTVDELKSATQKKDVNAEKLLMVARSKLSIDSVLFAQNVISKLDITNSFDNYLNYKNSLAESELAQNKIQTASSNLDNDYLKTQNALELRLIELNERIKELEKEKSTSHKELKNAEENLHFLEGEIRKQYIVADFDGEIMNLYNQKYAQNFVNKGDLLLTLVPRKDKYYAKVVIPQRDICYVKIGQAAHLKVDAFNFFEKGILQGEVSYVPDRKPKEEFFVIIDIFPTSEFQLKAGYSLKGEVIVERLKIYRFILKKLFKKLDESTEEPTRIQ
jgi:multidrug efflux pump subunit AcrA (membrane-fusion protein)